MDPFDTHPANPAGLEQRERDFMDLAREAVDIETLTDTAFDPATSSWDGIAAEELRAAPKPVRAQAHEVSSRLTWAATAINVWAGHVRTFNTIVDRLREERALVPVEVERFMDASETAEFMPPVIQDQMRESKYEELVRELQRRWWDAHSEHIDAGSREVSSMFTKGPTWENIELARDAGALSAGLPLRRFFATEWEAQVAPAEAVRLAGLFNDPNYKPTAEEIAHFHDLLEQHADDEAFWFEFLTDLGPEGLLTMNGNLALHQADQHGEWDPELAETIGGIQRLLGGGLALATTQRGAGGEYELPAGWLGELTGAGQQLYEVGGPGTAMPDGFELYGYQLLGPLLNHGDFDDRFLRVVGGDMIDFEMAQGGSEIWREPDMPSLVPGTAKFGDGLRLDWTSGCFGLATPAGFDPIGGLVSAMERNPEGALEILHGRQEAGVGTWSDGTPKEGVPLPMNDDRRLPRLDYLLTDREWPPDWVRTRKNLLAGAELDIGNESEALRQFGDVLVGVSRLDGEPAVDVVEQIVYEVNTDEQAMGYDNGEVPGEGTTVSSIENDMIHPTLRPALGTIMADHIWDVNRAVHTSGVGLPGGRGAEFDREQMIRFLADLGKDETAHLAVRDAQVVYAAASFDFYLSGDANLVEDSPAERRDAAKDVADQYGRVIGALDKGAEDAAWFAQWRADDAANAPAEGGLAAADLVVGTAGDIVSDTAPGVGYLGGELASAVLDQLRESTTVDNSGLVTYRVAETMADSRRAAAELAMAAVYIHTEPETLAELGLLENGEPKPMSAWDDDDRRQWAKYFDGPGRPWAEIGSETGESYDDGVSEAERILESETR